MTTSTTCNVYWVNLEDQVTEHDSNKATCDSSNNCKIFAANGDSTSVKCNSQLQQSAFTQDKYAQYFCTCGGASTTVPSIVNCADLCYTLKTDFQCNALSLLTGFTGGSPLNSINADQCIAYRCDSTGTKCTTDGSLLWSCDNQQHDSAGATSEKSYVCNCHGAASIPSLYQSNGQTLGTGCNGKSASTTSSHAAVQGGHIGTSEFSYLFCDYFYKHYFKHYYKHKDSLWQFTASGASIWIIASAVDIPALLREFGFHDEFYR